MTLLLSYLLSLLIASAPALTCAQLRAEVAELAAQVFRLEVENRALRQVNVMVRKWPGQ